MLHFGTVWVRPEYGALCLETPASSFSFEANPNRDPEPDCCCPSKQRARASDPPLGRGAARCRTQLLPARAELKHLPGNTSPPSTVSGRLGKSSSPPAHCPGSVRARKKEQEDPAFRAAALCLASGPWAEMPQVPSAAWPQRVVGTEAKPQNKAEFRRCSYEGASRGDSTGNTPLPLSMGDLFSEAQNAAERPHRGRLCSGRQRGHGATRTMRRVFVLPGSRPCLQDCGRSPDMA